MKVVDNGKPGWGQESMVLSARVRVSLPIVGNKSSSGCSPHRYQYTFLQPDITVVKTKLLI